MRRAHVPPLADSRSARRHVTAAGDFSQRPLRHKDRPWSVNDRPAGAVTQGPGDQAQFETNGHGPACAVDGAAVQRTSDGTSLSLRDSPCDFARMRECDALGDATKCSSSANGCAERHCGNWNYHMKCHAISLTHYRKKFRILNFFTLTQSRNIAKSHKKRIPSGA